MCASTCLGGTEGHRQCLLRCRQDGLSVCCCGVARFDHSRARSAAPGWRCAPKAGRPCSGGASLSGGARLRAQSSTCCRQCCQPHQAPLGHRPRPHGGRACLCPGCPGVRQLPQGQHSIDGGVDEQEEGVEGRDARVCLRGKNQHWASGLCGTAAVACTCTGDPANASRWAMGPPISTAPPGKLNAAMPYGWLGVLEALTRCPRGPPSP